VSASGTYNLAPFSFFTCASANPPVLAFCPMVKPDGSGKDTLANIRETREFVVNIVSEEISAQMNLTSGEYPPEVDEFAVSGLTPIPSDCVGAPRVAESSVNMECRLNQIVEVSSKPAGGSLVLGEVLRFHIDDRIVDGFKIDPDRLHAIGRMGGPGSYSRTRDRFELTRPKV
jgi:flavin reductase (DIM6/NTAB) family NADH-FMN oxidoreductase RutF